MWSNVIRETHLPVPLPLHQVSALNVSVQTPTRQLVRNAAGNETKCSDVQITAPLTLGIITYSLNELARAGAIVSNYGISLYPEHGGGVEASGGVVVTAGD